VTQPTLPRPASTVVLARPDACGGFEIFMNRRPEHLDTYAGVYVFPGGRVEPSDFSATMLSLIRGVSPIEAQQALGCDLEPDQCLGYWVAAVRELFEEAGIHFFVNRQGAPFITDTGSLSGSLAEKRRALQQGELEFPQMLDAAALHCDLSRLTYFFHRVTPDHYPTRFDTRFYLASLPPEQEPLEVSEEVAGSVWIAPQEALANHQSKTFPLMPPTLAVLRTLAEQPSWAALKKAYRIA
jgi:8-oxo-dGTP pyrophosphatase MutT (NUDIX family)